jgi:dATP pyrophosphohydrolase
LTNSEKFGTAPVGTYSVAVYILKQIENIPHVLMIKRNIDPHPDIWQPVTGRIGADETAWMTGLRETKEETGLVPDRYYSTNQVEIFYHIPVNTVNLSPAFVAFLESEQDVTLSREHKDFKWVTIEDAKEMVTFSAQRDTLRHINKYFIDRTPSEYLRIEL